MVNCMTCGKVFVCKDKLLKHAITHDISYTTCNVCFRTFSRRDNLLRHIRNFHKPADHIHASHDVTQMDAEFLPISHSTGIHWTPPAATPNAQQQAIQPLQVAATGHVYTTTPSQYAPALVHAPDTATTSTATVDGGAFSLIPHNMYSENLDEIIKTQRDRIQSINTPEFIEIDSSLQRKTVWYFRKNIGNVTSHHYFLHSIEAELIEILRECVRVHPIKYDLKLEATYVIPAGADNVFSEHRAFNSPARQLFVHSNIAGLVDCDFTLLLAKEKTYDSRFFLSCIGGLTLGVHQYNPPIGCAFSYLPLPENISHRRAVVNPVSVDHQSFKWAILAKHVHQNRNRITRNYMNEAHRYDFSMLAVPTSVSEIKLFERANPGTSVNVYGLKNNEKSLRQLMVYPLRVADKEMPNHFDLLLISNSEYKTHYAHISNLSRLVGLQINKSHRRLLFCKKCFKTFDFQPRKYRLYGEEALAQHRLEGKCVFDPNTALLPRKRNL